MLLPFFHHLFPVLALSLLLQTPTALPSTKLPGVGVTTNSSGSLPEWTRVRQSVSRERELTGFRFEGAQDRQILMINGTADDFLAMTFFPEPGFSASDYNLSFQSNNHEVLNPSIDILQSRTTGNGFANISAGIDFSRFPGTAKLTLNARRTADASLLDSLSVAYLVAGMVIYENDTRTIVSGAGNSLTIPSYEAIYGKPHWDLRVFVQYLNGSDSTQSLHDGIPTGNVFTLSELTGALSLHSGQIAWDSAACSVSDGVWNGSTTVLQPGCGMGFSSGAYQNSPSSDLHFALTFEKHRAGRFYAIFDWKEFTTGTEFEDEEHTTYLLTEILGTPPAVIRRIEPGNPFDKHGGEEIYVETINTADVNVTSFNVNDVEFLLVPGSRHVYAGPVDFFETAKFLTKPGTGKQLPWTVTATRLLDGGDSGESVAFIDETGFVFSYNDEVIELASLIPSSVSELGGEVVALLGTFSAFSPDSAAHNILIGNKPVMKSHIVEFSSSEIRFRVPPRTEIGLGLTFPVLVQVESSFSDPLLLTYLPSSLVIRGQVFGASSAFDGEAYSLSSCGNTTFVALVEGQDESNASYLWKVIDDSMFDVLSASNASRIERTRSTLELPNQAIPSYKTPYSVVIEVGLRNLSASYTFNVEKSREIVTGVMLIQPEDRTIAAPAVNMRIVAKIDVPQCFVEDPDFVYEWEYEGKLATVSQAVRMGISHPSVHDTSLPPQFDKFVFSYENTTGTTDDTITPTRLGREFVIPREQLTYGEHRVRLTVRDRNQIRFLGRAVTSFTVMEAELAARIGGGQLSRKASDSEDLFITGDGSFDPDIVSPTEASSGLQYEWACSLSLFTNLSLSQPCDKKLLPSPTAVSFTIPPAILQNLTNRTLEGSDEQVFLQFTLTIRKGGRQAQASQVVSVVKSLGRKMAQYERIEVLDSRGTPIDANRAVFWEDIVISPVASGTTLWRFRVDLPLAEKGRFLAGNAKIITSPGYYTTTGKSSPDFKRLPLGILSNKLSHHQTYQFSVTFQEAGKISNEVGIRLQTVEAPELVFPAIARSNGTAETVFRAFASTSFKGNASFAYQFYLIEPGTSTGEYCLDGCTGANIAIFNVPKPGEYVVQCRLLSADGKTLLAVKNNSQTLNVSSSTPAVEMHEFDKVLTRDFLIGDDGAVNQKGFFFAESMYAEQASVVGLSEDSAREACANYTAQWAKRSAAIVQNELPNTANARNYVRLASNYARLSCVEDDDTLYELLSIVDQAISRTPPEEVLTTSSYSADAELPGLHLEADLLAFYNHSTTRALSTVGGGSSRDRLLPAGSEVRNLILDLGEMLTKHLTTIATSGQVCGFEATYSSSAKGGIPDRILTPGNPKAPLGEKTMKVAVRCNPEQGRSLTTPYASFEWCDAVYELTGSERKLVTLAESSDFPFLSGVQGQNKSESERLVLVDITTLGAGNQLVSALSESMVAAQAGESGSGSKACYRVGIQMGDELAQRSGECSYNVPYVLWPRKAYGQLYHAQFEGDAYMRRTAGVRATAATRNGTGMVIAESNRLGLYGAYKASCQNALFGNDKSTLDGAGFAVYGILIGILLLIMVITLLTYTVVSLMMGGGAPEDDEAGEAYVERDYFGRREVRLNVGSETESATVGEVGSRSAASSQGYTSDRASSQEIGVGNGFEEDMTGTSIRGGMRDRPPI